MRQQDVAAIAVSTREPRLPHHELAFGEGVVLGQLTPANVLPQVARPGKKHDDCSHDSGRHDCGRAASGGIVGKA
jgi:hypothetical protein